MFLEDHFEGQQNSSLDPALTLESLVLEDDSNLSLDPCDGGEEEEEVVEEEEEEVEEEEGEVALFFSDFRVGVSRSFINIIIHQITKKNCIILNLARSTVPHTHFPQACSLPPH